MCVLGCLVDGWMFRLIVFERVVWMICIVLCKMLVVMFGWVGGATLGFGLCLFPTVFGFLVGCEFVAVWVLRLGVCVLIAL